jgi:hypothetical protein
MRVLLVGDDGVLEILAFRFMTQGIDFETSASVARSVLAAAYVVRPFDAVVVVSGAAGMSEQEILELMRLFLPDAPVFFVAPLSESRKTEANRATGPTRSLKAAKESLLLSVEDVFRVLVESRKAAA